MVNNNATGGLSDTDKGGFSVKIYFSKPNAYFAPRCIMVRGNFSKDSISYSEGRPFGNKYFFDDRLYVMEKTELAANFVQGRGE